MRLSRSRSRLKPRLGIIGFGAFGRLIANHLEPHVTLMLHDPAHQTMRLDNGQMFGSRPLRDLANCDYLLLAVPADQITRTCRDLHPHLTPKTVIIDVGSVKLEPIRIMQAELPEFVDIVGTHPLFGPQSAAPGLAGLKIAICPVRGRSHRLISAFVGAAFGLKALNISADQHDREAATVQGLTHLIARVLQEMKPVQTSINTASYDLLLQAINMVKNDAACVFDAIERSNPYAVSVRNEFFDTAARLRQRIDR